MTRASQRRPPELELYKERPPGTEPSHPRPPAPLTPRTRTLTPDLQDRSYTPPTFRIRALASYTSMSRAFTNNTPTNKPLPDLSFLFICRRLSNSRLLQEFSHCRLQPASVPSPCHLPANRFSPHSRCSRTPGYHSVVLPTSKS